jgi:lysophospholipase L1-like esterase
MIKSVIKSVVGSVGNSIVNRRGGGVSWATWWTSLISATVENAAPTHVVLTFPTAQTSLGAIDFTIAGFMINNASWAGVVLTLVLSTAVVYGDILVVTFINSGGTHAVTNNVLMVLPTQNADIIQWNSLDDPVTTGGNWAAGYSMISLLKSERNTGNGTISKFKFNFTSLGSAPWNTSVNIYIYRFNGTTYDIIYQEDVISKITNSNSIFTVDLATPVSILEGDLIAYYAAGTSTNTMHGLVKAANSTRYITGAPANPQNWNAGTGNTLVSIIHCLGVAPMIIGIGDSIMESYPLHTSMVDLAYTTIDISKSWLYKLHGLDNRFIYQNCGAGGETSTAILGRFNRDVVLKKPRFVVINGGVNDIVGGAITKATFLSNMEDMLDACVTNSIIPIIWKIMPWTNGSNANMQKRDDWNTDLETLFNTYSIDGKIIIDWDSDLGQFRAGGDAGNLWDIKVTYDNDGVHFNETGYAKIASVMLTKIENET